MTTREDQVRAARELAERNPEWVFAVAGALRHPRTGDCITLGRRKQTWAAYVGGWRRLRGEQNALCFRSPAAACRALGFEVQE